MGTLNLPRKKSPDQNTKTLKSIPIDCWNDGDSAEAERDDDDDEAEKNFLASKRENRNYNFVHALSCQECVRLFKIS